MLAHEEEVGSLAGIRVCRNAPSISHLFFADDSLILLKATAHNAMDTYYSSSGQLMSNAKSNIFFIPNTNVGVREDVCKELNMVTKSPSHTYLAFLPWLGLTEVIVFSISLTESVNVLRVGREKPSLRRVRKFY